MTHTEIVILWILRVSRTNRTATLLFAVLRPWAERKARTGSVGLKFRKTFGIPVPTSDQEFEQATREIMDRLNERARQLRQLFYEQNQAARKWKIPELDEDEREFLSRELIRCRGRISIEKLAWWSAHRLASSFGIPVLAGIKEHAAATKEVTF